MNDHTNDVRSREEVKRAGGSAWHERSIRNREIAGSNPAQSIINRGSYIAPDYCILYKGE